MNHHFDVDSQRREGKYQSFIQNKESDVWFGWYSQWLARLQIYVGSNLVWFSAYVVFRQVGVSLDFAQVHL